MADLNLKPLRWDWAPITTGDTYPATNISIDGATSTLSRVRIKFKPCGSTTASLTLDSATGGITITSAENWTYTINRIAAVSLTAGVYSHDMETIAADGTITTETNGTWEILPQITD
jgi:hypothetical protein